MDRQTKILLRVVGVHARNALLALLVIAMLIGVGFALRSLCRFVHNWFHISWTEAITWVIGGLSIASAVIAGLWVTGVFDPIPQYFSDVREQAAAQVEREELAATSERETLLRGSRGR